ncbi:MAG: type IV toxin-antitoxin system AbiEi family antitoxin domain-containing protein [Thermodesulfobacteriota bacterium]|nr:type IV toxin-antitoxin system AbiEi family antitoxin domain-containing protein [Thermodesulfobacteriota bacterium]
MTIRKLNRIKDLYFSYQDVAASFGISSESARVSCFRYVRSGDLVRLKRNYYMLIDRWEKRTEEETYTLANMLQVPSYISLTTALIYYGYTTQIQQGFLESVAVKRTREFIVQEMTFSYTKLKKDFYSDFVKKDGFFIARPEKALIDAVYLEDMGRYRLDTGSIDFSKFGRKSLIKLVSKYNNRIRQRVEELCAT